MSMIIRPLSPFGAEVIGLDLDNALRAHAGGLPIPP